MPFAFLVITFLFSISFAQEPDKPPAIAQPDGHDIEVIGPITWRRDGTVHLVDSLDVPDRVWGQAIPADQEPDEVQRLYMTVRIDADGNRWVVDSFDEKALRQRFLDYAKVDDSAEIQKLKPTTASDRIIMSEVPIEQQWFEPYTWTTRTCGTLGDKERVWGFESRSQVATNLTAYEKKFVIIEGAECSGTIVAGRTILTAAHCVASNQNNVLDPDDLTVCIGGGQGGHIPSTCRDATDIILNPTWPGPSYPAQDWVLVIIASSFHGEFVAMSSASPNIHVDADVRSTGYPYYKPTCIPGVLNNSPRKLFDQTGPAPVYSSQYQTLRTQIDAVGGQSGSPFIYHPNGCCSGSHFITGVLFGWNGFYKRVVGPHVSKFRSWVITNMVQ